MLFKSTQPEWAATIFGKRRQNAIFNLNPRSPSGLRQNSNGAVHVVNAYLNPRSPSGLRQALKRKYTLLKSFKSTQPEWAATKEALIAVYPEHI